MNLPGKTNCRVTVLLVAALGCFPVAQAVDIAPFVAQRFGGDIDIEDSGAGTTTRLELDDASSYGLIFDFDLDPQRQIEVYLSRQDTQLQASQPFQGYSLFDLTVDYYHIGGLYFPTEGGRFRPFVSGTLGLTRMDPQGAGLSTENFFSLALGGGATFFPARNLGLRFDARAIYTATDTGGAIFCSGGCVVSVSSEGFWQMELGAAVVLRF
jgi:hypothetical protein